MARINSAALGFAVVLAWGGVSAWTQTTPPPLQMQNIPPAEKPAAQAAPQAPLLLHAGVSLVDVPVLVLDKTGNPIDQLGQDDFRLTDDGMVQHIEGFDSDPRPISLAIIVDISDPDAIGQAKRSAQLLASMVVGAAGQASIFVPGPEPRQLLPFTGDRDQIANALQHLERGPQSHGDQNVITEPLNLAILQLRRVTHERMRAALVISKTSARNGVFAQALVESGMTEAIPIFRISPNRPKGAGDDINPISTDQRGSGQGSQRAITGTGPIDAHGNPAPGSTANLDLAPVIGAVTNVAGKIFMPHNLDYVYDTGGLEYSPGSDGDFDRKLSLIGDELRSVYHIYYEPNNLSTSPGVLHQIDVKLDLPATASVGTISYRHSYLGVAPPKQP